MSANIQIVRNILRPNEMHQFTLFDIQLGRA
jgi:hypothetical protein